jgi:predicted  nucleic acid-binding Zn-ribbon protein
MTQLWQLYKLQQTDSSIQELERRTEKLDDGTTKKAELDAAVKALSVKQEEIKKLLSAQRRQELEVGSTVEHQKKLQEKLWSGKVSNPKELENLQKETDQLKLKQKRIEDGIIEMMERLEQLEIEARAESSIVAGLEEEHNEIRARYEEELARIEGEMETLKTRREKIAENIEQPDMRRYETLRAQKNGLAVVKVAKGKCGGCFRNLPESVVQKVQARQMEFCNACGRILFSEGE